MTFSKPRCEKCGGLLRSQEEGEYACMTCGWRKFPVVVIPPNPNPIKV